MVTEHLLKTVISCFVCTMQENQFLLFLNHLRLPYSIPKSFALLLAFHCFRHTFATTVTLTNGVPIETVSKLLGHRSIRTTQIYAKVINEKLAEDMTDLATRIDGKFELASPKKAKPYLTMEEIEERTRRLHPDGNFKLKDAACYIS